MGRHRSLTHLLRLTHLASEFFPLLARQLHFCLASVSVGREQQAQRFNHDLATWLLVLCRTAVCAAFSNQQTQLLNRTGYVYVGTERHTRKRQSE